MAWNVYLAGEIHSDWRERIAEGAKQAGLDVTFSSPVTDHGASDDVGVAILGEESDGFWKDHKGAGVNAIRTQTLVRQADVVVVRFGDKYKQWNAAFDAGYAAAGDRILSRGGGTPQATSGCDGGSGCFPGCGGDFCRGERRLPRCGGCRGGCG